MDGAPDPNLVRQGLIVRRKWPLIVTAVSLVVGMAYMFEWNRVAHHASNWDSPGDMWGMLRAAHYVGWGFLGGVYTPTNGVISFPGMPVLLAPVAVISGALHLTESSAPFYLSRPTSALILEPVELLLGSLVVFATDAVAERWAVPAKRRIGLCVIVGIVAWPVSAVWGHAEDTLSLTFALYALIALLDGRWAKCGWLMGFGVALQPLVVLMVPLLIGATPPGRRFLLMVRSFALSFILVGVAALGDFTDTYRALVKQPTPPWVDHATPWITLAPRLPSLPVFSKSALAIGHRYFPEVAQVPRSNILVSGGPGRIINLVVAVLIGLYVWRHPQSPSRLLWLVGLVLGTRCLFEAVMTPYYLVPPIIMALVLLSLQGAKRFWAGSAIALGTTIFAYHHLSPWAWWLPVITGSALVLALGFPDHEDVARVGGYAVAGASKSGPPDDVNVRDSEQHDELFYPVR